MIIDETKQELNIGDIVVCTLKRSNSNWLLVKGKIINIEIRLNKDKSIKGYWITIKKEFSTYPIIADNDIVVFDYKPWVHNTIIKI